MTHTLANSHVRFHFLHFPHPLRGYLHGYDILEYRGTHTSLQTLRDTPYFLHPFFIFFTSHTHFPGIYPGMAYPSMTNTWLNTCAPQSIHASVYPTVYPSKHTLAISHIPPRPPPPPNPVPTPKWILLPFQVVCPRNLGVVFTGLSPTLSYPPPLPPYPFSTRNPNSRPRLQPLDILAMPG